MIDLNISGKHLIFYDFETEMIFNPAKLELTRPIEVYMQVTDEHLNKVEELEYFIKYRSGKTIDQKVTDLTTITQEQLDTFGYDIEFVFEKIHELLSKYPNHIIIGHNSLKFDNPILNYRLEKYGFKTINVQNTFDTAGEFKAHQLGWNKFDDITFYEYHRRALSKPVKGLKFNLGVACEHYNVEMQGWHRAKGDVVNTIGIFRKQISRYGITL